MKELLEIEETLASIEKDVQRARYDVRDMIKEAVRQDIHSFSAHAPEGEITLGHWLCDLSRTSDPSPTGYCVYDDWEDPPHDHCLYCGHPEERK